MLGGRWSGDGTALLTCEEGGGGRGAVLGCGVWMVQYCSAYIMREGGRGGGEIERKVALFIDLFPLRWRRWYC